MRTEAQCTFIFLFFFLFATGQDWFSKIDPFVWQTASAGQEVDFLIVLTEQANITEAQFLTKKEEKGAYVFQKLSETAERSQLNVLKTIEEFQVQHRSFWIINAVWAEGGPALLKAVAQLPEVAEIHSNPVVRLEEPVRDETGLRTLEWGITNINADDVWAMGYKGEDVVVAGQDTGYDWDVAALKLKYRGWDESNQSSDHNYNWHDAIHSNSGSNDCGVNSTEPCDDHNHGTHTMGTMVGLDGANEIGVAPDAKWIGCRNMDNGNGTPTTYIECFEWLLAPTDLNDQNADPSKAPHVINNSWACPTSEGCNSGNWSDMEAAINNLLGAGVVVVASAGNSGSNCETVNAPPAIFDGSFSVGASNSSNGIGSFSSRGPVTVDGSDRMKPDVAAPGVSVRSCIRNGAYATWNGTSMAGPHVAGAVALLISADPSLAGQVAQIEDLLETTAGGQTTSQGCGNDTPTSVPNNVFGHGIIDVEAAVNSALVLLPVELVKFTGILASEGVLLDWAVALPGSLNHFEIEHSVNGTEWKSPGKVPFSPSSPGYSFLDKNPGTGVNYYRLNMVDIDGSFEYSKVVSVRMAGNGDLSVSPNPAGGALSLFADWESRDMTVLVFNVSGKLMQQLEVFGIDQETLSIDVADLPSGAYFIKVLASTGNSVLFQNRFIKF